MLCRLHVGLSFQISTRFLPFFYFNFRAGATITKRLMVWLLSDPELPL